MLEGQGGGFWVGFGLKMSASPKNVSRMTKCEGSFFKDATYHCALGTSDIHADCDTWRAGDAGDSRQLVII